MAEKFAGALIRANEFLNDAALSMLRRQCRDSATYNAILHSIVLGAATEGAIALANRADSRTHTEYPSVLE